MAPSFQFTSPRGAISIAYGIVMNWAFQFTPHAACDEILTPKFRQSAPRTHTRRAMPQCELLSPESCFNSRSHARCELGRIRPSPGAGSFNSRTHAGCDVRGQFCLGPRSHVSIHAPTQGATASLNAPAMSMSYEASCANSAYVSPSDGVPVIW